MTLIEKYIEADGDGKISTLVEYLVQNAENMQSCWETLDCCSVDVLSFERSIREVLESNPFNLPANRLSAWLYTREGDYAKASINLKFLIARSAKMEGERKALMRLCFLNPSLINTEIISETKSALSSDLTQASYDFQLARVRKDTLNIQSKADALQSSIASVAQVFRSSVKAGELHQLCGPLLDLFDSSTRIALVGNGPSLKGANRGKEIDRYDLVIRCNFPVITGYEADVGTRTDVVFFTEALFRMIDMYLDRHSDYRSINLCTIENSAAAAGYDSHKIGIERNLKLAQLPGSLMTYMHELSYGQLTTGAQTYLFLGALLNKQLTLFGFDFYSSKELHYFPQTAGLWLAHEVQYEKFLVTDVLKPAFSTFIR